MIPVLDISHWKYPVDFRQVKAHGAGFNFCIAKATEAESWTDTRYAGYVRDMNAAGIVDGSYHYFRVLYDPTKQARHYYETAYQDGIQFPPIVDIERINNVDGVTRSPLVHPSVFTTSVKVFLDATTELWGRRPWIYTNAYSWHTLTTKPAWAKEYPLWVANYGVSSPALPSNWVTWMLWQYTASYDINGKKFDANWFPGTEEELLALCGANPPLTLEQKVERLWLAHPELH